VWLVLSFCSSREAQDCFPPPYCTFYFSSELGSEGEGEGLGDY
jgi:hypothetical protein